MKFDFKKIFYRKKYIDSVSDFLDSNLILVFLGQRRVGKSYMIFQLIKSLLENKVFKEKEVFYINKEYFSFEHIKTYEDLKKEFFDWKKENKVWEKFFIALDEVQEIQDWEKFVLWIWSEYPQAKIVLSGSNSKLLSKDISTKLRWRYIEKTIYPLDFNEFCEFYNLEFNQENFNLYMQVGWLPELKNIQSLESKYEYLKWIYNTIFVKDIQEYFSIKNIKLLQQIHQFLFSQIWDEISISKIYNYLKSLNYKVWPETIWNYLKYSIDAFLFQKVDRFDLKWKKILEWNSKYYANDIWLRNAIVGYNFQNLWKLLENIVYLHLVSNGYDVKVGKYYDKEIDFVAQKNSKIIYVQVTYLLNSEQVINREFWNLLKIKDNWEKIVVSMDQVKVPDYEWIKWMNILDFVKKY